MQALSVVLSIAAIAILVGCGAYHIGWHPEWTQSEGLLEMWPGYLLGFTLAVATMWEGKE